MSALPVAAAALQPMPRQVALLLPVWGSRHVAQFLDCSLPTLLWPGNLPALTAALPCDFTVLTCSADAARFADHPNWQLLGLLCPVRIVAIDDLVSEASYAVTLTLAYARAVRAAGPAALDTGFLFLVSDFLFADGALAAVLERWRRGASAVLSGNFRVPAEAVAEAWPGGSISPDAPLGPRALLRWSLDHLDPASRSAIVNSGYQPDTAANRLFWRVDDDTLIGRFYLAHMIGIRPEVTVFRVGAACDYSFVPELCPSGRVELMTDSDEFFVTEMVPAAEAAPPADDRRTFDAARLARDLSRWTTAQHRANAQVTVLFHAAEPPASTMSIRTEADATIAAVAQLLAPDPQPHRGHPYWIGGTALRQATTGASDPEELRLGLRGRLTALWWRLRLDAFGRPPDVRRWHPRWPDFAAARRCLDRGRATLILSDEPHAFGRWAARWLADARSLSWSAAGTAKLAAGPFDQALLVVTETAATRLAESVKQVAPVLAPDARIVMLLIPHYGDDPACLDPAGRNSVEAALRAGGWSVQCTTVPIGPVRRSLQRSLVRAARLTRDGGAGAILGLGACAVLALLGYFCNEAALRRTGPRPDRACSSALFVLRRQTSRHAANAVAKG